RAGDTFEIAYRAQADIQIELLAQRDVDGTDAPAHRRGQRAFDRDHELARRLQRLLGQPDILAVDFAGFLTGKHFHPLDATLAAVSDVNCGIDHLLHHRGDVDARPVSFDVRNDGLIRHLQGEIRVDGDLFALAGHAD